MIPEEISTPAKLRTSLLNHVLNEHNALCCVTEGINNSDLFSVSPKFLTTEFECKFVKSDLVTELNAIKRAIHPLTINGVPTHQIYKSSSTKYYKHSNYLSIEKKYKYKTVPNRFCFAIPQTLETFLCGELADINTPYGIIVYKPDRWGINCWQYVKMPKFMHKDTISTQLLAKTIRRLSFDLLATKQRLYK